MIAIINNNDNSKNSKDNSISDNINKNSNSGNNYFHVLGICTTSIVDSNKISTDLTISCCSISYRWFD